MISRDARQAPGNRDCTPHERGRTLERIADYRLRILVRILIKIERLDMDTV
jgi:hypothetical protein